MFGIIKLLLIYVIAYLCMYLCTYSITYINKKDDNCIMFSNFNKHFLCNISAISWICLYIFNKSVYVFFSESLFINILIIIGYIDFKTYYVYDLISNFLLGYAGFIYIIKSFYYEFSLINLKGILAAVFIIIIFTLLKFIGQGDLKVYVATFLIINNSFLCPIIFIIFSLGISGLFGSIEFLLKRRALNSRRPLCSSIAVTAFLMMILT